MSMQQVDVIIKITNQSPISMSRAELVAQVEKEITLFQQMISRPVELLAVREEAEIFGNDETKPPVVVTVRGGVVQDVENVPPGVTIEIHDWDNADEDSKTASVDVYPGAPVTEIITSEKALRFIANINLWGEVLEDPQLIVDAADSGELGDDDEYNPSSDTECNQLRDCVETARDAIVVIDRRRGFIA